MISFASENGRKKKGICTFNSRGNNRSLPPNIMGFPAMMSSSS